MKKAIITILIIMAILHFNIAIVTIQNTPIQARNNTGQYITLYQAKTRHNRQYLLDDAIPGNKYIIIEYKHNLLNSEDNEILCEKEI